MDIEKIMEMLDDLEEAQNALKPRGEQFPNCMEKITEMARYWRNVIDKDGEIRDEDIEATLEKLHIVKDIVWTYLHNTDWKDRRVTHVWQMLNDALSYFQSVEKM